MACCSFSRTLPTTTEPSSPALIAIWRAGQDSALRTISTPVFWSSFLVRMPLRRSAHADRGPGRDGEHRHALRLRAGMRRSDLSAAQRRRCRAAVPRAERAVGSDPRHPGLPRAYARLAARNVAAARCLARHRPRDLFCLWEEPLAAAQLLSRARFRVAALMRGGTG